MFFTFYLQARSAQDLFSCSGKSTRLLFQNVEGLLEHIQKLDISMGFSNVVECNMTGTKCHAKTIESEGNACCEQTRETPCNNLNDNIIANDFENDEIVFVHSEQNRYRFYPMSQASKQESCIALGIPYAPLEDRTFERRTQELGIPSLSKEITGDGNCFSEQFHIVSHI